MFKVGIGQDSHRFDLATNAKNLVLGGVVFDGAPALQGNSDADVVLHAITNAVSGITGVNILGKTSDDMCRNGVTDSKEYLKLALSHLQDYRISHVSVAIECKSPKIAPNIEKMKDSIAAVLGVTRSDVGITATSGEGLTAFGRGEGVQAFSIVSAFLDKADPA